MRIFGILTSYFPDLYELENNIRSYISELDLLIIWENTPKEQSRISDLIDKLKNPKIEVRTTGENEYLAKPFNECIEWAEKEGFTHMLTMDQDSHFLDSGFTNFINKIESNKDSQVMMFCPAKTENKFIDKDEMEVENSITSGTVYKMELFARIGCFREDFLMYMVDIEFGMRVRKFGYKIICYPRILLNHYTGYAQNNKLGWKINNYSPQSTYYIVRNVILNWQLYPEKFSAKEKLAFYKYKIGYRTIKIFFESQPFKKLKAIYMGLFHGLTGKSGRFDI
jgi:rhamnosyltransferase